MTKSTFLGVLVLSLALISPAAAQDKTRGYNPCGSYAYDISPMFKNELTPGIPWPALNELLGVTWADDKIKRAALFDPERIEQAIHWVALDKSEPPDDAAFDRNAYRGEKFKAGSHASDQQQQAYADAAELYHAGETEKAIAGFDKIIADSQSPFRAAAAYSAARASLNLGKYHEGISRLKNIIDDVSMREFSLAAFHLIGTRAYQSGAPELIAAHFAEMQNAIQAPPTVLCHDLTAQQVVFSGTHKQVWDREPSWMEDLSWYLTSAFPNDFHGFNATRRDVLDQLAQHDPFFDLVRALAAPPPYGANSSWIVVASPQQPLWRNKRDPSGDDVIKFSKELTAHARQQWDKTHNPLWGYALAKRTGELDDLPRLEKMLAGLQGLPQTEALTYAKEPLRRHFVRHATRLLIMSGKLDEAIAFLRSNPINQDTGDGRYGYGKDAKDLLNGGIRFYLEQFDLESARKWAKEAGGILSHAEIEGVLRPLLAASYEEFLSGNVPGDGRNIYGREIHTENFPYVAADLLSTKKLRALSENDQAPISVRRTLLSSAWLRTYLLQGWQQSLGDVPQVRALFPELATDMDDIQDTSFDDKKANLLTHTFLRTPGINYRPSWARAGKSDERVYSSSHPPRYNTKNIFAIDDDNPNDSNWWCSADIDRMKIDMVVSFYVTPVGGASRSFRYGGERDYYYADPLLPAVYFSWDERFDAENRKRLIALADKVIAWHPLFKEMDNKELSDLTKVQNGPALLSQRAVRWAEKSNVFIRMLGFDRHLPESLHLAVRSTRYGCRRNGSNVAYSHAAFAKLHDLYPRSEWAAKTPYWFDLSNTDEEENDQPVALNATPRQEGLFARTKSNLKKAYRQLRVYYDKHIKR